MVSAVGDTTASITAAINGSNEGQSPRLEQQVARRVESRRAISCFSATTCGWMAVQLASSNVRAKSAFDFDNSSKLLSVQEVAEFKSHRHSRQFDKAERRWLVSCATSKWDGQYLSAVSHSLSLPADRHGVPL